MRNTTSLRVLSLERISGANESTIRGFVVVMEELISVVSWCYDPLSLPVESVVTELTAEKFYFANAVPLTTRLASYLPLLENG